MNNGADNREDLLHKLFELVVSKLPLTWKFVTTLTALSHFLPFGQQHSSLQLASPSTDGHFLRSDGVLLVPTRESKQLIYFRGLQGGSVRPAASVSTAWLP